MVHLNLNKFEVQSITNPVSWSCSEEQEILVNDRMPANFVSLSSDLKAHINAFSM